MTGPGIRCWCGAPPVPMPSVGGAFICACGLRYTVTVDAEQVYRRIQELARNMDALAKLDPVAAMARAPKGGT